jgi:hypothetical protein
MNTNKHNKSSSRVTTDTKKEKVQGKINRVKSEKQTGISAPPNQSRKGSYSKNESNKSKQEQGHGVPNNKSQGKCYRCGSTEHYIASCDSPRKSKTELQHVQKIRNQHSTQHPKKCTMCSELGHIRRDCPRSCNRDGCNRGCHTPFNCRYKDKVFSNPIVQEQISDEEDKILGLNDIESSEELPDELVQQAREILHKKELLDRVPSINEKDEVDARLLTEDLETDLESFEDDAELEESEELQEIVEDITLTLQEEQEYMRLTIARYPEVAENPENYWDNEEFVMENKRKVLKMVRYPDMEKMMLALPYDPVFQNAILRKILDKRPERFYIPVVDVDTKEEATALVNALNDETQKIRESLVTDEEDESDDLFNPFDKDPMERKHWLTNKQSWKVPVPYDPLNEPNMYMRKDKYSPPYVWYTFEYKQPFDWHEWKMILHRFGWNKIQRGRITVPIKELLDNMIGAIRGYSGYMAYAQAIKNNEYVMSFINQMPNEEIVNVRMRDVLMYYWSTTTPYITTLEKISKSYQTEISKQSESSKRLHVPILPLNIPWARISKALLCSAVALLGLYACKRAGEVAQKVGDDLKTHSSKLVAVGRCAETFDKYSDKISSWFGKKSLFPSLGDHGVYLEEMLKCFPGFAYILDILENYKYGRNSTWHRRSMAKNFTARLNDHLHHNAACDSYNANLYNIWIVSGLYTPYEETTEYVTNPRLLCSHIPYVKNMPNTVATNDKEVYYYGICYNLSYFFCPAKSFENMEASLEKRVLCIENTVTTPECQIDLDELLQLFTPPFDPLDTDDKWFFTLRAEQRRMILKHRLQESEGRRFTNVPANIKIDESLWGEEKRLPRFLCNLAGHWHDLLGPCFSQLSEELAHGFFSGEDYFHVNGVNMTLTFAHGYTNVDLDHWFNSHLYRPGLHVICMGDDMMGIDNRTNHRTFIECDFSKYDRTQNAFLLGLFWKFLDNIGLIHTAEVHRELYKCNIQLPNFKNQPRKFRIKELREVKMRFTGEGATCLANTITNFVITMLALTSEDPEQTYRDCGVLPKLYYKEKYTTFLKGVWLLGDDEKYYWTKLPSFLSKFGKSLTDPLDCFSKKHSASRRYCQFLYGQLMGYGAFANNSFYKSFETEIHRLCFNRIGNQVKLAWYPWEIKITEQPADVTADFLDFCYERYKMTDFELQKILAIYQNIKTIPCLFHSPEMTDMGRRDYG